MTMASLFKWDPAVGGRFHHLGLQASECQDSNSAGSWASEWRGEHLQVLTEGGECHPRKASSRGDPRASSCPVAARRIHSPPLGDYVAMGEFLASSKSPSLLGESASGNRIVLRSEWMRELTKRLAQRSSSSNSLLKAGYHSLHHHHHYHCCWFYNLGSILTFHTSCFLSQSLCFFVSFYLAYFPAPLQTQSIFAGEQKPWRAKVPDGEIPSWFLLPVRRPEASGLFDCSQPPDKDVSPLSIICLFIYFWPYHAACRILVPQPRDQICAPWSGSPES